MVLRVGQEYIGERLISSDLINKFGNVVGDHNPIHFDQSYASTTVFKKPIAHGMLIGGIISSILANEFPGPGTIYLDQFLKFNYPIFHNDNVTIKLLVSEHLKEKIYKINIFVTNNDEKVCVEGTSTVLYPIR